MRAFQPPRASSTLLVRLRSCLAMVAAGGALLASVVTAQPPARELAQSSRMAPSPLGRGLASGPFTVGYQRAARSSPQMHAWYPASASGTRMTLAAYLGEGAPEFAKQLTGAGVPAAELDSVLYGSTRAMEGATPLARSAPLVVIAQGNAQDAADQAILAEFLASHGYVVATTPSPMIARRMTREDEMTDFAELQAAQMDSALQWARALTGDRDAPAVVVGHSFGARAALLFVMQHPEVRGLVSLDGGIGTSNGLEYLRRSRLYDSTRTLPPILHEYETLDAFMSPDLTFLRGLRTAKLSLVQRDALHHVHFTTLGFLAAASPTFARVTRAGAGLAREVVEVAESVKGFLDAVTAR